MTSFYVSCGKDIFPLCFCSLISEFSPTMSPSPDLSLVRRKFQFLILQPYCGFNLRRTSKAIGLKGLFFVFIIR